MDRKFELQPALQEEMQLQQRPQMDLRQRTVGSIEKFIVSTIIGGVKDTIRETLKLGGEVKDRILNQIHSEKDTSVPDPELLEGFERFMVYQVLQDLGPSASIRFDPSHESFTTEVETFCKSIDDATQWKLAAWATGDPEAHRLLEAIPSSIEPATRSYTNEQRKKIAAHLRTIAATDAGLRVKGEEHYNRVRKGSYARDVSLTEFGEGYTSKVLPSKAYELVMDTKKWPNFHYMTGDGLFFNGFHEHPINEHGIALPSEAESIAEYLTWKSRLGAPEYWLRGWRDEAGLLISGHSSLHSLKNPSDEHLAHLNTSLKQGVTGLITYIQQSQRLYMLSNLKRIEEIGITWSNSPYATISTWENWSNEIVEDNPNICAVTAYILKSIQFDPIPNHLQAENLAGNKAIRPFIEKRFFTPFAIDNNPKGPTSKRIIHQKKWDVRPFWEWFSVHPDILRERCKAIRIGVDKKFGNFPERGYE